MSLTSTDQLPPAACAVYQMDQAPELVRPSLCVEQEQLRNPAKEPEISSWGSICAASQAKACNASAQPRWLQCSFRSLSSFSEIQAAIRQHGSVITRISINSDWATHFSGNNSKGFASEPYKVSAGARPLFGHALIITGYDNREKPGYTWTLQNSWVRV